jgi:hypothetical protein
MYFANPWGLLGLAALPAIVAIHLFRRRFPPLYVAGAHLWGAETRVTDAGRRRDRLPITASLLLELLAALLLTLALSDPRFADADATVHLVAVLDDSASMQSSPAGKTAFRDRAIAELRERARQAGREARLTLIRTGRHPALIGSRGMSWVEAELLLKEWTPSAATHDFHAAWDEAVQLVGREGWFLFLTDHPPDKNVLLPKGMEVAAFGEALGNVAFTAARWTVDADGGPGQIFLRVANLGKSSADVAIRAESHGQPVFTRRVTLPASSELPVEAAAPPGLGQVKVRLVSEGDPLAVDNEVTLIEPQPRIVHVAVDLPVDSYELQLAQRALSVLPGVELASTEEADLLIGEAGAGPPARPEQWWLGVGPLNRSDAFRKQAADFIGPYLVERQHPLLDGVSLGGIVWGGVQPTELRLAPLVSVNRTTVLGRLEGTPGTAWVMNIDLARSNLGDSPDWPILVANLVELRRDALPGLRRWNYRLEESVQLRAPATEDAAPGELTLLEPGGRRKPLVRDRNDLVELPPLERPGVYHIMHGAAPMGELAVNYFDNAESTLLALSSESITPEKVYEPAKISLDNPFSWLIVLAILLILASVLMDWHILRRGSLARTSRLTPARAA